MTGRWLRALRCPRCGGPKITTPTTGYVYCDYCAALYDWDLTSLPAPRLDPAMTHVTLHAAVHAALRDAFARKDRDGYAAIQRRLCLASFELTPEAWSPRIGDDLYRRALLDDWCVPSLVAKAFDESIREAWTKANTAADKAGSIGHWRKALALLEMHRAAWRLESALYDRLGLWRGHPDSLNGAGYVRLNEAYWLRSNGSELSAEHRRALYDATGFGAELLEAEPATLEECTCARCGAHGGVPEGSRRVVCEACGAMLETGAARIKCTGCGAPLTIALHHASVSCGHCGQRFEYTV